MEYVTDAEDIVGSLRDLIEELLGDSSWTCKAEDLVEVACEAINNVDLIAGQNYIIDMIAALDAWTPATMRKIDRIVEMLENLLQHIVLNKGEKVVVDFDRFEYTFTVSKRQAVIVSNVEQLLLEETNHAIQRGDYIPERIRRAYEEILR